MKNCDPLVFGPAFAILTVYGLQMRQSVKQERRLEGPDDLPIMPQSARKLIFKLPSPNRVATCSISKGVARLDHELRNDAVEDHALKVATPRVAHKVLDGLRGLLREEPEVHVAERRVDRRRVRYWGRTALNRRGRGGDRLLLARGALVEDVAFTGLVPVSRR